MRQRMSEQLAASADPESIDAILMQMDEECEGSENGAGIALNTRSGPFSAFRVSSSITRLQPVETENFTPDATLSTSEPLLSMDLDGMLSNDSLMEFLFPDTTFDDCNTQFLSSDISPPVDVTSIAPISPCSVINNPAIYTAKSTHMDSSLLPPPINNIAPEDAPFLLNFYQEKVVQTFSPVCSDKSPWQILHIPNAMETLGQLTMGKGAGDARMCIFYAILATSALVQRISSNQASYQHWQMKGDQYSTRAQLHLKLALRDIESPVKTVKYKDLLLAFLCLATVFVS